MRLGLFAEDNRLSNGAETHFLTEIDLDDEIPWQIIHEIERFLHLKIIVCEDNAAEFLKTDFCHMEQANKPFRNFKCDSQRAFLLVLHDEIVEHFCDSVNVDQVDAVFFRS